MLRTTELGEQLFHDRYPEFYMHMHAHYMESGGKTLAFQFTYFAVFIAPVLGFLFYMQRHIRGNLHAAVSPGKDNQEHMGPRLLKHLKANQYDKKEDFLGRRNGEFYATINKTNYQAKNRVAERMVARGVTL